MLVVGAGLAGLTAARALRDAGRAPVLLDKARRAGGRCATRTLAGAIVDTGAQFFTARSDALQERAATWQAEGMVRRWSDGFARAGSIADAPASADTGGDGHPRYSVTGGMNRLPATLAEDLDVRTCTRVTSVRGDARAWVVTGLDAEDSARRWTADAVLLTPPLPQTLALLAAGRVEYDEDLGARLRGLAYEPCLTLMVALDAEPGLPGPGGVQFATGPVTWLADNVAKGASAAPSLTLHARWDWSETFYGAADAQIAALLLDVVRPWLSGAEPVATGVFRWRYAKPRDPDDVGALLLAQDPAPLVLAGDALAGAKVEGAVTSGLEAARLLGVARPS